MSAEGACQIFIALSLSLSLSLSFKSEEQRFFSLLTTLSLLWKDKIWSAYLYCLQGGGEREISSLSLSLSRVDAAAATHFFSLFSSFLLFFFSSQKDFLEIWKLKIKWPFEKRKVEELEELEVQEKWEEEEEEEEREVKTQFWRDWSSSSSAFSFQLQRRRRAKSEWLLRNAERRSRRRKERKDSWKCFPLIFSLKGFLFEEGTCPSAESKSFVQPELTGREVWRQKIEGAGT